MKPNVVIGRGSAEFRSAAKAGCDAAGYRWSLSEDRRQPPGPALWLVQTRPTVDSVRGLAELGGKWIREEDALVVVASDGRGSEPPEALRRALGRCLTYPVRWWDLVPPSDDIAAAVRESLESLQRTKPCNCCGDRRDPAGMTRIARGIDTHVCAECCAAIRSPET